MNGKTCPVPLYHGTSSLFLAGIAESGLGGRDLLGEWRVLDLAREVAVLAPLIAERDPNYASKCQSFQWMVEQRVGGNGGWNFEHGHAYVTPAVSTAIRYATNKRFGSELLTYTLDLLGELVRMNAPGVRDVLYRRFPDLFHLMDISPAPLLVRIDDVPEDMLLREGGGSPASVLELIREELEAGRLDDSVVLQQCNFRLAATVRPPDDGFWFINVTRWDPQGFLSKYTLHQLDPRPHV